MVVSLHGGFCGGGGGGGVFGDGDDEMMMTMMVMWLASRLERNGSMSRVEVRGGESGGHSEGISEQVAAGPAD